MSRAEGAQGVDGEEEDGGGSATEHQNLLNF